MKSNDAISIVSALLILLFVYTAMSKLLDFEAFRGQMLNQPLPRPISSQLVWAVPSAELLIALLLINRTLRIIGLAGSILLMLSFTVYVGMVLINVFEHIPCSCGGIMESLSWEWHLVINTLFLTMATTGLILEFRKRSELTVPSNKILR